MGHPAFLRQQHQCVAKVCPVHSGPNLTAIISLTMSQELFNTAAELEYKLVEQEASSFIPYLVNKVSREQPMWHSHVFVRAATRSRALGRTATPFSAALLRSTQLASCLATCSRSSFCTACSVFMKFVSQGLKSKNSKQRAECLIEISHLIERHGMSVCQIGAAKALKSIAEQISDRDNGVRSAGESHIGWTVPNTNS